jgi:hypothetical protein
VFKNLLETLFVERMDQSEEIFVRFMNDPAFPEGRHGVDGFGGVSQAPSLTSLLESKFRCSFQPAGSGRSSLSSVSA